MPSPQTNSQTIASVQEWHKIASLLSHCRTAGMKFNMLNSTDFFFLLTMVFTTKVSKGGHILEFPYDWIWEARTRTHSPHTRKCQEPINFPQNTAPLASQARLQCVIVHSATKAAMSLAIWNKHQLEADLGWGWRFSVLTRDGHQRCQSQYQQKHLPGACWLLLHGLQDFWWLCAWSRQRYQWIRKWIGNAGWRREGGFFMDRYTKNLKYKLRLRCWR